MRDSKVISLLRAFSEDEFKSFESFLLSPFFNQSNKLVKLFRLLKPDYARFNLEE